MSRYRLLSPSDSEWTRMWDWLRDLTGDYADLHQDSREVWQYTGTFLKRRPAIGSLLPLDVLVHQFRHRDRPSNARPIRGVMHSGGRLTLELVASYQLSGNWNVPMKEGSLA